MTVPQSVCVCVRVYDRESVCVSMCGAMVMIMLPPSVQE